MKYDLVLYEVDDFVATITLNNPERLNAWSFAMDKDIRAAFAAASTDPKVRAIVLTGAGRGFCVGQDTSNFAKNQEAVRRGELKASEHDNLGYLTQIPKPIVAAINGPAAGFGACVSIFADYRFINEDAKFTTAFGHRGLIAEFGIAWMLPRQVGLMHAMDLLTGRIITGREAGQMGFAIAAPPEAVLPRAVAFAREIAKKTSPRSFGIIKRQLYLAMEQSMKEAIDLSNVEAIASLVTEDHREGVAALLEKRMPNFTGR